MTIRAHTNDAHLSKPTISRSWVSSFPLRHPRAGARVRTTIRAHANDAHLPKPTISDRGFLLSPSVIPAQARACERPSARMRTTHISQSPRSPIVGSSSSEISNFKSAILPLPPPTIKRQCNRRRIPLLNAPQIHNRRTFNDVFSSCPRRRASSRKKPLSAARRSHFRMSNPHSRRSAELPLNSRHRFNDKLAIDLDAPVPALPIVRKSLRTSCPQRCRTQSSHREHHHQDRRPSSRSRCRRTDTPAHAARR